MYPVLHTVAHTILLKTVALTNLIHRSSLAVQVTSPGPRRKWELKHMHGVDHPCAGGSRGPFKGSGAATLRSSGSISFFSPLCTQPYQLIVLLKKKYFKVLTKSDFQRRVVQISIESSLVSAVA